MRGDIDLGSGVRSAGDRADGDAICALIRCAEWPAKRKAGGAGARGHARARARRRPGRSGGGRGVERAQPGWPEANTCFEHSSPRRRPLTVVSHTNVPQSGSIHAPR